MVTASYKKRVTVLPVEKSPAPTQSKDAVNHGKAPGRGPGCSPRKERSLGFHGEGVTSLGNAAGTAEGPPGQGTSGTKAAQKME